MAAVEFSLDWQSQYGQHRDIYFLDKVDFWRDVFPGKFACELVQIPAGQTYKETFEPGVLVPGYSDKKVKTFAKSLIDSDRLGETIKLVAGRFYPQGIAWKPLNSFPESLTPMRLLEVNDTEVVADMNHPLCGVQLELKATLFDTRAIGAQRGGALQDIAEVMTANGPGMQVPVSVADFYDKANYPFTRADTSADALFYQKPRLVHHLDETARSHVRAFHERLLKPGSTVLDLMGSWESHLPDSLSSCIIEAVGLNEQELKSNGSLSRYLVQDLNMEPELPYEDQSFDAVVCTVSMEYLIKPREVMAELARILRPGGVCATTVSERWFPGKQIDPWSELHPFERQGHVLSYFLNQPGFENFHTKSIRGYPRPSDDKYGPSLALSDALYMIWANRSVDKLLKTPGA